MSQESARLIVRYGPAPEDRYVLAHATTNLGREPFNDIVINVPELSRRHARIVDEGDYRVLEDLNSTNGTTLNGRRIIEPARLENGDEIGLADVVAFTFVAPGHAAPIAASQATPTHPTPPPAQPYPVYEARPAPPPPPQYQYAPAEQPLVATGESGRSRGCTRYVLGCLLLLLFLVLGCGGTLFALDAFRPDYLYCGVMEPVVALVAETLTFLGFGPYQPLPCPIA